GGGWTAEGMVGQVGQKIGGPFDKEGMIGKQFTTEGKIGGGVEKIAGEGKSEEGRK
ncbi:hypothetical protein BDZ91DRAFT_658620, partial [Kalaharituber pfeilii]